MRLVRLLLVGSVSVLAVAIASFAFAQPANEADAMFRRLDVNGDGSLTVAESTGQQRRMVESIFQMAGKPTSGSLSRGDFQKVFDEHQSRSRPNGQAGPAPAARPTASGDLDGDGRITRAELQRLFEQFDHLDANQDGALDESELTAAASRNRPGFSPSGQRPAGGQPSNPPKRATPPQKTSKAKESTGLEGTWRGWVVDGRGEQPDRGHMQMELRIAGTTMSAEEIGTNRSGGGLGDGTFTVTGNGRSGNLDATGTSGQQNGRSFMGIYEVDGDTLRWCVGNRRARPTEYSTARGNYLMVLRRQP
jgi:uncharacterized protein (TIGR03067 family)